METLHYTPMAPAGTFPGLLKYSPAQACRSLQVGSLARTCGMKHPLAGGSQDLTGGPLGGISARGLTLCSRKL